MFNVEKFLLNEIVTYKEFLSTDPVDVLNCKYGFEEEIKGSLKILKYDLSTTSKGKNYKTNRVFYSEKKLVENSIIETMDKEVFEVLNCIKKAEGKSYVWGYVVQYK